MKGLPIVIAGVLALSVNAECQTLSLIERSYSYLLTTQTHPLVIKSLAEAAADEETVSEELLDIAAEVLWEHAEDKSFPKKAIQALWTLLREVNVTRYRKVLAETGPATGLDQMQASARRLLQGANADLNAPGIYQRGTISLSALRQRFIEDALKAPVPDSTVAPISRIELEQSAEKAFEILGYPQAVDASAVDIPLAVSIFRLSLLYRGQGAVVLQKRRATESRDKPLWSVAAIVPSPLAYELDMPYVAFGDDEAVKLEVYANILLYGDSVGIRRLMMRIYDDAGAVADPEILDLAAERLANEYEGATDGAHVEMLSWVSKTLALKGAGRYDTLLKLVSQRAPSSKLRKYSTQKRSASAERTEQFEPGEIDLAAVRRTHPPLYAGVAGGP